MKVISIILIVYLIQVSVCESTDAETTIASEVLDSEEESLGMKEKLQVDPEEDDEDGNDESLGENGGDIQNQDDDQDPNGEPTPQPNAPSAGQPGANPEQPKVYAMPGAPDSMAPTDYNSGYNPASARADYIPAQCHGGQYQCQKMDPKAQTRCIPQEWRCNGLRDCELNDDESGCTTDQLTRGRSQTKCTHDQHQCAGSGIGSVPPHCIERRFVCDGTYHCSYGDDEANCVDRNRPQVYPSRNPVQQQPSEPVRPEPSRPDPRDNRDMYRPQPQSSNNDRKSEEYVQRLEWRDRCFRSCLKY